MALFLEETVHLTEVARAESIIIIEEDVESLRRGEQSRSGEYS